MGTVYTLAQPLIAGTAYTFPAFVGSQADTDIFQTNVTLAAGDVKISKDGGAFANLTNLPTETGTSGALVVALTTAETTGVTNYAIVKFTDAAGDEWQDVVYVIPAMTAVTTVDVEAGAITFTYTLTSSVDSAPIDGATVWATTDAAGSNVVASDTTNSSGEVTFYLDAGTYYFWSQKSGWTFTNPDTEVVS